MNTIKTALLLTLFLLSLRIFAQPPVLPEGTAGTDYNLLDQNGEKHGPWARTYSDGIIYYTGQFEHGTPTGLFNFYYDTGELMSIVDHIEGTAYTFVKSYEKNGAIMSEGHYRAQELDGETERLKDGAWKFYTNGKVISEEEFQMGVQHGTAISYYADGKVAESARYNMGRKDGPWKQYFDNGKPKVEGTYSNGDFEGDFVYYHPNGVKLIQGNYVRGMKNGTWIKFTSAGEIELVTSYKLGNKTAERRENGEFMDYYDSGIPMANHNYSDGKKDGPFTEWYDQGEWIKVPLDTPQPGGGIQFKQKLEGTQVSREGDYMDGKLEGEITYYNEEGRIIKIEVYEAGELISSTEK